MDGLYKAGIIQSKTGQTQKQIPYDLSYMWDLK